MELKRLFQFLSDKEEPLKALPDKHARFSEGLLFAFRDSQYANKCQTLQYKNLKDDEQITKWRAAIRVPGAPDHRKWSVLEYKIRSYQYDDKSRPLKTETIESKAIRENISFFEALEDLSLFEKEPFINQRYETAGPTAQTLGSLYYKNLALIEGIIFDLKGDPCPTVHGEIIVPGSYAAADLKKLKEAYDKAHDSSLSLDKDLISRLIEKKDKNINLDEILELDADRHLIHSLYPYLLIQRALVDIAIEGEFDPKTMNLDRFKQMTGANIKIKTLRSTSRNDKDKKWHLNISLGSLEIDNKLYTSDASLRFAPTDKQMRAAFANTIEAAILSIDETISSHIDGFSDKAAPIGDKIINFSKQQMLISALARAKLHAIKIKDLSLADTVTSEKMSEFKKRSEDAKHKFIEAGGSKKQLESFEQTILNGTKLSNRSIPWNQFDSFLNDLQRTQAEYKELIKHHWKGHPDKDFYSGKNKP
jgi:hypothetical protein